jgi:sugar phosphate isomerase/epimerase
MVSTQKVSMMDSHSRNGNGDNGVPQQGVGLGRRKFLQTAALAGGALAVGGTVGSPRAAGSEPSSTDSASRDPYRYCLNAALIRGYKLDIVQQIDLAAAAGYRAIEPWLRDLTKYREEGGSLSDLKKRIADLGLTVESAIAFAPWIVDDPQKRAQAVEQMKTDMEAIAQIGGTRIAAPPSGATNGKQLDLMAAAERYRKILEVGDEIGVIPQIEVWGFSVNLHRLGQSMFVVIESGHPKACLLPDFYHIYKGGSSFEGLKLLSAQAVQVFHMNDYPDIPREEIADKDRIFPGDGIAPLPRLLREMRENGVVPVLSIEIFNREYWEQYDAKTICEIGLKKMKAVTAASMSETG